MRCFTAGPRCCLRTTGPRRVRNDCFYMLFFKFSQKIYSVNELEQFAVVLAIEHFKYYLFGQN